MRSRASAHPTKSTLRMIPLGGMCEIGKNMTAYEYGNDIIIVDCGQIFPDETMPGVDADKWYAGELGAVYEAGLLDGFDVYWFDPEAVMTRADAMQLLANVLAEQGRAGAEMRASEVMQTLARFPDVDRIPESRRRAAAVCVRAGVVQGDENGLRPADAFTRAEFAKILLTIADQG